MRIFDEDANDMNSYADSQKIMVCLKLHINLRFAITQIPSSKTLELCLFAEFSSDYLLAINFDSLQKEFLGKSKQHGVWSCTNDKFSFSHDLSKGVKVRIGRSSFQ